MDQALAVGRAVDFGLQIMPQIDAGRGTARAAGQSVLSLTTS